MTQVDREKGINSKDKKEVRHQDFEFRQGRF